MGRQAPKTKEAVIQPTHMAWFARREKMSYWKTLFSSRVISTTPSQYPDCQGKNSHVHFGTKERHRNIYS